MDRILALLTGGSRVNPHLLGLAAGLLLVIIYFSGPYSHNQWSVSTSGIMEKQDLIFNSEAVLISATAVTALAVFLSSTLLFRMTGIAIFIVWLADLVHALEKTAAHDLGIGWVLFPVAALLMIAAGSLLASRGGSEDDLDF